jgi:hypothetical protein
LKPYVLRRTGDLQTEYFCAVYEELLFLHDLGILRGGPGILEDDALKSVQGQLQAFRDDHRVSIATGVPERHAPPFVLKAASADGGEVARAGPGSMVNCLTIPKNESCSRRQARGGGSDAKVVRVVRV